MRTKNQENQQNDGYLTNRMVLSSLWMCGNLAIVRMFFETPRIPYQPLCISQYSLFNKFTPNEKSNNFTFRTKFSNFFSHSHFTEEMRKTNYSRSFGKHEKMHDDFFVLTQLCFMQLFFAWPHLSFIVRSKKQKKLLKLYVDDEDNDDELGEKKSMLLLSSSSFIRTLMPTNTNTIAKNSMEISNWKIRAHNRNASSHWHYLCVCIIIRSPYICTHTQRTI